MKTILQLISEKAAQRRFGGHPQDRFKARPRRSPDPQVQLDPQRFATLGLRLRWQRGSQRGMGWVETKLGGSLVTRRCCVPTVDLLDFGPSLSTNGMTMEPCAPLSGVSGCFELRGSLDERAQQEPIRLGCLARPGSGLGAYG